jgi:glycosyltransferase involved in cell wall biosynthesis
MDQQTQIKKIKAFPLYMGASGCDYHRVRLPFIYGAEYYDHLFSAEFKVEKLMQYLEESDVAVLNRDFPLGVDRMKAMQEKGVKFVVDLDDWIELPWYHPNYLQYRNGGAKAITACMKQADMVTVTTDRLYKRCREINSNCHVIPNALPYGFGQFRPHPAPPARTDDRFNFVYTGQSSHLEDVRLMQPLIHRIKTIPGISFSLAGYKPHKVWRQIEAIFKNIPGYKNIPAKELENYMQVYDEADCSVVPLCMNDFNAHKSNLKLLEAAAKKLPVIVSNVPPYRDDADAPVLWVNAPSDWYKHMKFLTENRNAAKELGQKLHEWASEKFNLVHWNRVRFELYNTLVK